VRFVSFLIAVAAVVGAMYVAAAAEEDGGSRDRGRAGSIWATVERVVDGDTVVLSEGIGKSRLIGVDTPEVHGGVECFGREASAFTKRVLDGARVRVGRQAEPADRYGRALVDLWLEDGRFFNALLVERGFAQPLTVPPNVRYADRFVRRAREARAAGRGLWAAGACG
jgi:micrococcal nuclease